MLPNAHVVVHGGGAVAATKPLATRGLGGYTGYTGTSLGGRAHKALTGGEKAAHAQGIAVGGGAPFKTMQAPASAKQAWVLAHFHGMCREYTVHPLQ